MLAEPDKPRSQRRRHKLTKPRDDRRYYYHAEFRHDKFVAKLSKGLGRVLSPRKRGPKPRAENN